MSSNFGDSQNPDFDKLEDIIDLSFPISSSLESPSSDSSDHLPLSTHFPPAKPSTSQPTLENPANPGCSLYNSVIRAASSTVIIPQLEKLMSKTIAHGVGYRSASKANFCYSPPPGFATIYTSAVESGLGFPIHPFVSEVLRSYNIAPFQLSPPS